MYLSSWKSFNKSQPKKKVEKEKKKGKKIFINRITTACFREDRVERIIKAKLTNSELITVKSSGNSIL